jgi:hypothetical protein
MALPRGVPKMVRRLVERASFVQLDSPVDVLLSWYIGS